MVVQATVEEEEYHSDEIDNLEPIFIENVTTSSEIVYPCKTTNFSQSIKEHGA